MLSFNEHIISADALSEGNSKLTPDFHAERVAVRAYCNHTFYLIKVIVYLTGHI